jgi:hypothetical protein
MPRLRVESERKSVRTTKAVAIGRIGAAPPLASVAGVVVGLWIGSAGLLSCSAPAPVTEPTRGSESPGTGTSARDTVSGLESSPTTSGAVDAANVETATGDTEPTTSTNGDANTGEDPASSGTPKEGNDAAISPESPKLVAGPFRPLRVMAQWLGAGRVAVIVEYLGPSALVASLVPSDRVSSGAATGQTERDPRFLEFTLAIEASSDAAGGPPARSSARVEAPVGAECRSILISGLDENGEDVSVLIALPDAESANAAGR